MYVRTDEGLGFSFSIPAQGVDIDFKKAVRLNRYYRKTLGWEKDYERILRLLGYATTRPPDEESFAQAVAFWQRNQGLKGKEVDGVIGPNTWRQMQAAIPGAQPSVELPSATSAAKPSGESPLAIPAAKRWDSLGKDRPEKWQGRVYGLVVHTTGGSLPTHARSQGVYPTVAAVNYYSKSRGCHYVNGWRGMAGGDLLQMANERKRANGVGVTNPEDPSKDQQRSISLGRFEQDLPPILVRLWRQRWPGYEHSLSLLPAGETTANSCYIHVECIPCVYSWEGRYQPEVPPMREGLRFTRDQHDTVAHLACDIARRNGWPGGEAWWRTPRLVGHEDLTPISRHDKRGGWDPGYLREQPYFDWDYVYQVIEKVQKSR